MDEITSFAIGKDARASGPAGVYCDATAPHDEHLFGFSVPDVVMRGRWWWSKPQTVRGGSTVYRCPGR